MKTIYGMKAGDVWWTASDMGWVVGHSYICYGPLLAGLTSVMYEGKPDRTPDAGQYFRQATPPARPRPPRARTCGANPHRSLCRIIQEHQVNAMFTAPTTMRLIRRADPMVKLGRKYSTKS